MVGQIGRLVFGVDWCFGNIYWDNFEEKMDICRLILFIPSCEFISILGNRRRNLFIFPITRSRDEKRDLCSNINQYP